MCIGLHVEYPSFLSDLLKLEFLRQVFEKYSNIKSDENPSSGSRVVARGRAVGRTGHDEALRTRLKATPSSSLYVGANISNEHTVSSFRVRNHQPEYVIRRDHRVNLHIVH